MASTPTVIRHAKRGNTILQVITYFERSEFRAVFQEYTYNTDTGRTVLNVSEVYLSEQGATLAWQSALYSVAA